MHGQEGVDSFALVCPHCQDDRTFQVVHSATVGRRLGEGKSDLGERLGTCRVCGLGVLLSVAPTDDGGSVVGTRPHAPPITRRHTAGLPEGIANDLLEACRCYSFMAYRGAGLLARRAVEQAVVMLGVPLTKRTLHQKLDWLLDAGHLPKRSSSTADTMRDIANAAAHGASAISREEAHTAVSAALAIVTVLVGDPGRAAARRHPGP